MGGRENHCAVKARLPLYLLRKAPQHRAGSTQGPKSFRGSPAALKISPSQSPARALTRAVEVALVYLFPPSGPSADSESSLEASETASAASSCSGCPVSGPGAGKSY